VFIHEAVVWAALAASCALGITWMLRKRSGAVRTAWFWVDTILTGLGLGVGAWGVVLGLAALFARL
jgi:hypothetical protein